MNKYREWNSLTKSTYKKRPITGKRWRNKFKNFSMKSVLIKGSIRRLWILLRLRQEKIWINYIKKYKKCKLPEINCLMKNSKSKKRLMPKLKG